MTQTQLKIVFALLFCMGVYMEASAQTNQLWTQSSEDKLLLFQKNARKTTPQQERIFRLNLDLLKSRLNKVQPIGGKQQKKASLVSIPFPDKNGKLHNFEVWELPLLSSELQEKFPNVRSYIGKKLSPPYNTIRFSLGTTGLHVMNFTLTGDTEFIDPYTKDGLSYTVYSKNELPQRDRSKVCLVKENSTQAKSNRALEAIVGDGKLRTFRLALSCTGQYAQFHLTDQNIPESATEAEKKAAVLSAMNTSMTRVNGIFERDVALTMQLVANNETIIYLDGNTDPYVAVEDHIATLNEIQTVCDTQIGTANYDMGHLFKIGGAGYAALSSVCTSIKGKGFTGTDPPLRDAFDIDFVAHEIGHQFGATHSFNNSCRSNRTNATAVEPGSGSTIMGYAGFCSPNIQEFSDAYFHTVNVEQMYRTITVGASTCATITGTGNTPPTANAGLDYTIPKSTPFVLSGSATDTSGNLTHCWEQTDTQIANMPPLPNNSGGPSFRSLPPTTDMKRFFPKKETVLAGETGSQWEQLPSVNRNMNFSYTVRDNELPAGQVARDKMTVTVTETAGPFLVTSQNEFETLIAQSFQTVTWDIANTNLAPVNATTVDIFLSTDGGQTFPIVVATDVPNDGSEQITIPNNPTTTARIKVAGSNNIFYNINTSDFEIIATNFSMTPEENPVSVCAPNSAIINFDYNTYSGFSEETTFQISGLPEGVSAVISPETAIADNTAVSITISNIANIHQGVYDLIITGTSATDEKNTEVRLDIFEEISGVPSLICPANNSINTPLFTEFHWAPDSNIRSYLLEISSDPSFMDIIDFVETSEATYISSALETETTYYWRVQGENLCETGNFSPTNTFQTGSIESFNFDAETVPALIPDNDPNGLSSDLTIDAMVEISDINILINIEHPYVSDLFLSLTNPNGEVITLAYDRNHEGANYTETIFDDAANLSIPQGSPPYTGSFKPAEPLSNYNFSMSNGTWTLFIEDTAANDEGNLLDWSLQIEGIDASKQRCDLPLTIAPKGFSPNNDGVNETWILSNINIPNDSATEAFPIVQVRIYKPTGELIYISEHYDNLFDGTSTRGEKLQVGSYIYEITSENPDFTHQNGWLYIKY